MQEPTPEQLVAVESKIGHAVSTVEQTDPWLVRMSLGAILLAALAILIAALAGNHVAQGWIAGSKEPVVFALALLARLPGVPTAKR